jgi:hypothetical protein
MPCCVAIHPGIDAFAVRRTQAPHASRCRFYAAGAWLLVQVATQVFPFFDVPNWAVRWIVIAVVIGFPFAMVFACSTVHSAGLKRESEIERSRRVSATAKARSLDHRYAHVRGRCC